MGTVATEPNYFGRVATEAISPSIPSQPGHGIMGIENRGVEDGEEEEEEENSIAYIYNKNIFEILSISP